MGHEVYTSCHARIQSMSSGLYMYSGGEQTVDWISLTELYGFEENRLKDNIILYVFYKKAIFLNPNCLILKKIQVL